MADVHDRTTRSYNMSRIKGKDTKPEEIVRKYLFSRGYSSERTTNDIREHRISFCLSIRQWYLSMDVFGTDMLVASILSGRKQIRTFGKRKSSGTSKEIKRILNIYDRLDGKYTLFGSANLIQKRERIHFHV